MLDINLNYDNAIIEFSASAKRALVQLYQNIKQIGIWVSPHI